MRIKILSLVLLMTACGRDDSALERQLAEHEKRIAALELKADQSSSLRRVGKAAPTSTPMASPLPASSPMTARPTSRPSVVSPSGGDYRRADPKLALRALCSRKWGSNWEMVEKCESDELAALEKVMEGNSYGLPPDVYREVAADCADKHWPQFTAQLNCQGEAVDAFKRGQ